MDSSEKEIVGTAIFFWLPPFKNIPVVFTAHRWFPNFLNHCSDIKFLQESFVNVEPDDVRFKNVKVVLVTADCSKSGIANPIDFIVNEGEGESLIV